MQVTPTANMPILIHYHIRATSFILHISRAIGRKYFENEGAILFSFILIYSGSQHLINKGETVSLSDVRVYITPKVLVIYSSE